MQMPAAQEQLGHANLGGKRLVAIERTRMQCGELRCRARRRFRFSRHQEAAQPWQGLWQVSQAQEQRALAVEQHAGQ
jgi:hypothetical protein